MSEEEAGKRAAARAAVERVEEGMVVGLGSGSTAELAIEFLAERARGGLRVTAVPTSTRSEQLARALGIPLIEFQADTEVDLTIDGADEVVPGTLAALKGRGGALVREKLVAVASRRLLIVVDRSKIVERLGTRCPLPVEVVPFGWSVPARGIERLGGRPALRVLPAGSAPYLSDNGNYILDVVFDPINDPVALGLQIKVLTGVIDHGLFTGVVGGVLVGDRAGVEELTPSDGG